MKKYILPLMSIAMLMAMVGCSSSDDAVEEIKEESKLVPMTFTATQESNVGTRAALNGNSVDWQTEDKISVFDGTGAGGNHEFTLTGDAKDGKFSGEASSEAATFTAVYPYTDEAQLGEDGSVSSITLPAEQTATPNSFDPAAALMMAVSTEENKNQLNFKNAVSLVKVTTEFACKSIVLSANENIAGTGKLTYNSGAPSITFESNQSQTITLKPATDGGEIAEGTYYIAICPHTSTGFSIRFINSNDTKAYTRTSIQSNTFNRSKIKDLGTFTESGKWTSTIESNGKVKASQQIDLGLTITADSKEYKVIFAKTNLTATGLAENEYDYGDYFAWGATAPWCTQYTRTGTGNDVQVSPMAWENTQNATAYDWSNVPFRDGNNNSCNQYINNGDKLAMEHDAACQILGGEWQLPTKDIWNKLCDDTNYEWQWTTQDGYCGRKVTSITDNTKSIFLPAAGEVDGTSFNYVGSYGEYWSGTAYSSTDAYYLSFDESGFNAQIIYDRYCGYSVRPVRLVELSATTTEGYNENDFQW